MNRSIIGFLGVTLILAACGGDVSAGTTTVSTPAATSTTTTRATTTTSVTTSSDDEYYLAPTTTGSATTTAAATTTTTTAAATTTTTAAAATTTTTAAAATTTTTTAPAGGSTVTIGAQNFGFSPATVTIRTGDTVQWLLQSGSHTTTSGASPTPDGLWDRVITADSPVAITFDQAGQFRFFCRFHPDSMQGTVVVEP